MGITIDKAIDIMEHYKEYGVISQRNGRNKAIDTMRKYQMIKQIAKQYKKSGDIDGYMQIIIEVLEDGQNTIKD